VGRKVVVFMSARPHAARRGRTAPTRATRIVPHRGQWPPRTTSMSCPHQHGACRASAAGRPAPADELDMLRMGALVAAIVVVEIVVAAVVAVAVLSVRELLSMVLTAWS
jgi:hypothetical protein